MFLRLGSSLLALTLPTLFAFAPPEQIIYRTIFRRCGNIDLHSTSTSLEWKSVAQPRFDEFASRTVGPWFVAKDGSKHEVEEVMRSCGGAIQGIKELPLPLVCPNCDENTDTSDQRTYHNRADGGFVYTDDGSYSAGPEHCDFVNSDIDQKLFMTSLPFGKQRLLMTSTLDSVYKARSQCDGDSKRADTCDASFLELSRTLSPDLQDAQQQNDIDSEKVAQIRWSSVLRVRMPNPSQAWSLARAKWERSLLHTDENNLDPATNTSLDLIQSTPSMVGSTEVAVISETTRNSILFGDLVGECFTVKMQAISVKSQTAMSAIRCYDTKGQLKAVAFLGGTLYHA